jgi:hypothetical protein
MSNTETPTTLVKIGGWLQIPFSLLMIIFTTWYLWLLWPVFTDPLFWPIFGWWIVIMLSLLIVFGTMGFILAFVWLRWQHDIAGHRNKLIGTGIVAMIFTGTVPGLLVLIGAAIYPTSKP